jgi:hypothetical protein
VDTSCGGTTYGTPEVIAEEYRLLRVDQLMAITIEADCPTDFRLFMNINVFDCSGKCLIEDGATTAYSKGQGSISFDAIATKPYIVRFQLIDLQSVVETTDSSWIGITDPLSPSCGANAVCVSSGVDISTPSDVGITTSSSGSVLSGGSFDAVVVGISGPVGRPITLCGLDPDGVVACEEASLQVPTTSAVTISMSTCPLLLGSNLLDSGLEVQIRVSFSARGGYLCPVSETDMSPSVTFTAVAGTTYTVRYSLIDTTESLDQRFIRWGDDATCSV